MNYFEINKESWNEFTPSHVDSDFYDVESFKNGVSSLNHIELEGIGEVSGKDLLHLQCHFGMDTLSLARLGANVTGVDLSDVAIQVAKDLSSELNIPANFINSNVYDLDLHLDRKYDVIYTSYGVLNWLEDLDQWAELVHRFLKPNGVFFIVEFHPFIYTLDHQDMKIKKSYFKTGPLESIADESYTDGSKTDKKNLKYVEWNHSLSEVISSLRKTGLQLESFNEYPYQVYNCFDHMAEIEKGKWVFEQYGDKIPYLYSLKMIKN